MALIARETGGTDFKKLESGTHMAVCNMIVDLGMQESPYGIKRQLWMRWETPHERTDDGKPMVIGTFYTLSLSEKANLRHDLEAWRGRAFSPEELTGFDVFKVLGHACQITVMHKDSNGKIKAVVTGVTAIPKGIAKPTAENELISFSLDEPDESVYQSLPDWLKAKINRAPIAVHDQGPAPTGPDFDDDIPF